MREVKFIGIKKKEGTNKSYKYSIFECEECGKYVEKIRKSGLKAKSCSHKCSRYGKRRGSYAEKVEIKGYLYIYKPDHPSSIKMGYVAEHRLIVEDKIKRFLRSDEVVHHINEDKHDNRVENLQVMTLSEHSRLHAELRWGRKDGKFMG